MHIRDRLSNIRDIQQNIENIVASGVESGVGVHCSFIEWHKLQVEYFSLYKLLEESPSDYEELLK
jgi:hypothetical protein